jgi:hypothetical protein
VDAVRRDGERLRVQGRGYDVDSAAAKDVNDGNGLDILETVREGD